MPVLETSTRPQRPCERVSRDTDAGPASDHAACVAPQSSRSSSGWRRFDRMRSVFSRKGSPDVFLYAFDVLELDGRDLRAQSWDARRALLTQLLDRCQDGLRLSEHIADTDGAVVFRQVCVMGLEGIVAKRRDSRYRSGRCREWIKVKNRAHPAFERAMLIALSKRTGSRSR
jgi:ATP-dependent DNA ligase